MSNDICLRLWRLKHFITYNNDWLPTCFHANSILESYVTSISLIFLHVRIILNYFIGIDDDTMIYFDTRKWVFLRCHIVSCYDLSYQIVDLMLNYLLLFYCSSFPKYWLLAQAVYSKRCGVTNKKVSSFEHW